MTTIKFKRPDGEARLSWAIEDIAPDGHVRIDVGERVLFYGPRSVEFVRMDLRSRMDWDKAEEILLAAESLRNEKRALAKDGSEWRSSNYFFTWSEPTLEGCKQVTFALEDGRGVSTQALTFAGLWEGTASAYTVALKSWHRAAFLPILPDDCAYPPNELPRRMADDEVRFPDGSAGSMRIVPGGLLLTCGDKSWSGTVDQLSTELNLFDPSQLARLQSFWDRAVKGPPVELAEEVLEDTDGERWTMRMAGKSLEILSNDEPQEWIRWSYSQVQHMARRHGAAPNLWPRALAYFDRHVAKPEPARVTDVRYQPHTLQVWYGFTGGTCAFNGEWYPERKAELHPLDIALIERCWAEGRLGEREVLDDSNRVGKVGPIERDGSVRIDFGYFVRITPRMLANDDDSWCGEGFNDLAQRARVRAIVAGMQKDSGQRTGSGSGPDAVTNPAPVNGTENQAAVLPEAHSGSPSGEVKAPFGLEPDSDGNICFGPLRFSRDPRGEDDGNWFLTIDNIERTGDPETCFREIAAALSDHIRRGDNGSAWNPGYIPAPAPVGVALGHLRHQLDDAMRALEYERERAVDLTELREAWKNWTPGAGSVDGFNDLIAAVERLVTR